MKENFRIDDLQFELQNCSGYMVGITFLKDGVLTHHLLTSNFPTGDIKTSINELKKLAYEASKPQAIEGIDENTGK